MQLQAAIRGASKGGKVEAARDVACTACLACILSSKFDMLRGLGGKCCNNAYKQRQC